MASDRAPLTSLPKGDTAVVVGASGAVGSAVRSRLVSGPGFAQVIGLSRGDGFDLTDETSIAAAADRVAGSGQTVRLVVDATGYLHGDGAMPEKSWRDLDSTDLAHAFAINAIGPALLMKRFLPLLPHDGKSVFATLSARVGSIGDNRLGGWYGYRASKAALNQIVRTAAIELQRRRPEAVCVALHPGTVNSRLSAPFAKDGLDVVQPDEAADRLLTVIDRLDPTQTGGFFDYRGEPIPW